MTGSVNRFIATLSGKAGQTWRQIQKATAIGNIEWIYTECVIKDNSMQLAPAVVRHVQGVCKSRGKFVGSQQIKRLLQTTLQYRGKVIDRPAAFMVSPGEAVGAVTVAEKQQFVLRIDQLDGGRFRQSNIAGKTDTAIRPARKLDRRARTDIFAYDIVLAKFALYQNS